jgi:hypothetical protein
VSLRMSLPRYDCPKRSLFFRHLGIAGKDAVAVLANPFAGATATSGSLFTWLI